MIIFSIFKDIFFIEYGRIFIKKIKSHFFYNKKIYKFKSYKRDFSDKYYYENTHDVITESFLNKIGFNQCLYSVSASCFLAQIKDVLKKLKTELFIKESFDL